MTLPCARRAHICSNKHQLNNNEKEGNSKNNSATIIGNNDFVWILFFLYFGYINRSKICKWGGEILYRGIFERRKRKRILKKRDVDSSLITNLESLS
ncbi:hypothetical protein V6Z11_D11G335100 [Gossypium hirsutum]